VFPELVVTSKVRDAISGTLRAAAKRGTPSLQFVVAGSGKTHVKGHRLPLNECHVFGSRGEELFRQAKINHFSMRGKDAKAFCTFDSLEEPERSKAESALLKLGDDEFLPEAMRAGNSLIVFDSALGRLIVLICEDLAAPYPSARISAEAFPDWVFSPVMDTSVSAERWHWRMGDRASTMAGGRVVVANSLLLEKLRPSGTKPIGYGLIVTQPHPWKPTTIEVDRVHAEGEWWSRLKAITRRP
jgi:predicted amidohydrolase